MTTREQACLTCPGDCRTCTHDLAEWPPRPREQIATDEAGQLPYAGANAPWTEHDRARAEQRRAAHRTTAEQHRLYGTGGLFG